LFYWSHITRRAETSQWGNNPTPICGVPSAIRLSRGPNPVAM